MNPHRHSQIASLIVVAVAAAVVMSTLALHPYDQPATRSNPVADRSRNISQTNFPPSLDCAFNAVMHSSAVIYFYFDVAVSDDELPRFYERAFVSADGTRRTYDGDQRPSWTYDLDGTGQPTITAPDGATQIIIYGLKLGTSGEMSVEAGLRSQVFRNMGGVCRQTNLAGDSS